MNKSGFSLVELLVALSIIALSLSFFAYFSDALKLTSSAKNEAAVAAYSRNYLETLRAQWQDLTSFEEKTSTKLQNVPEGYDARISIEERRARILAKKELKEVVVLRSISIILMDEDGKEFTMSTQIARPLGN